MDAAIDQLDRGREVGALLCHRRQQQLLEAPEHLRVVHERDVDGGHELGARVADRLRDGLERLVLLVRVPRVLVLHPRRNVHGAHVALG